MKLGTRGPSEPFLMDVNRAVCLEDSPRPRTLIADDQPDVHERTGSRGSFNTT